jgi:hypothetical protein
VGVVFVRVGGHGEETVSFALDMAKKKRRIAFMEQPRERDVERQWAKLEARAGFVQLGLCVIAAEILFLVFLA